MALRISTKGRYALRVMVDLAERRGEGFVPLEEITERQNLSKKYLENIISVFSKNGYVKGHRGRGGGYILAKDPADVTVGEVLRAVEGTLAPVSCLGTEVNTCERAKECKTLPMWEDLHKVINEYFDGITVADLAEGKCDEL